MPIEKLKFHAHEMNRDMLDPSKWELNNVEIIIMTKINELIESVNKLSKTSTVFPMPKTRPEDLCQ
jgi:hypothetical protein